MAWDLEMIQTRVSGASGSSCGNDTKLLASHPPPPVTRYTVNGPSIGFD